MTFRQSLRQQVESRLPAAAPERLTRERSDAPVSLVRITAEPPVAPRQHLRRRLYQQFLDTLERDAGTDFKDADNIRKRLRQVVEQGLEEGGDATLSGEERRLLVEELFHEVGGMGPLGPLFADPAVCDILVNGPFEVWVDRGGRLERTQVRFDDDAHVRRVLDRLVGSHGRRIDESSPMVDARLPDGSRVHAIIPPLARQGPILSIRRFRRQPFTLEELYDIGTLSETTAQVLVAAVRAGLNVLICGGAATGKTTLLNVLGSFIPARERVVTIEETGELRIEHPHVIPLEARPPNIEGRGEVSLRTLVKNALRMRADRIVVGEVRGPEVMDMLQAMNVGHDGSLTTVHANSPDDAMRRLHSLALMAGDVGSTAVRELVGSAFHMVAHMTRFSDGTRRLTSLREVRLDGSEVVTRELFRFERTGMTKAGDVRGHHIASGHVPRFASRLEDAGLDTELFVANGGKVMAS